MKEEFVNALMEKYSFFYRDPEKKVYKKYPKQAISKEVGDDINTYLGIAINEQLDDEIIVTVIATGFEEEKEEVDRKSVV